MIVRFYKRVGCSVAYLWTSYSSLLCFFVLPTFLPSTLSLLLSLFICLIFLICLKFLIIVVIFLIIFLISLIFFLITLLSLFVFFSYRPSCVKPSVVVGRAVWHRRSAATPPGGTKGGAALLRGGGRSCNAPDTPGKGESRRSAIHADGRKGK